MKCSYYLASLCLLISTYCYSQYYQIEDKYRGDPFFRKINMNKLQKDCTYPLDYWQLSGSKREEIQKLCPLNNLKFNFEGLYKFIYKEPVILYNGKDFQLTLGMFKNIQDNQNIENNEDKQDNDVESGLTIHGGDIFLSIVRNNIVEDQIFLADNFIDLADYVVAYQYYFISPEREVYTLYLMEDDGGITPMLWKHYKIDNKKMKFVLQDMLINVSDGVQYQIIYPNQFNVISNKPATKIDHKKLKSCEDKYDKEEYYNCYLNVYNYYNNKLKQKINLLNKKNNTIKKSYLKLQQNMASDCLMLPPPVSGDRKTDHYLSNVMFCLIQNYKQEITNIEKQLAH